MSDYENFIKQSYRAGLTSMAKFQLRARQYSVLTEFFKDFKFTQFQDETIIECPNDEADRAMVVHLLNKLEGMCEYSTVIDIRKFIKAEIEKYRPA